jgi:hypothetical protein
VRFFQETVRIGLAIEQGLSTVDGWQHQIGRKINGVKPIQSNTFDMKMGTKILSPSYSLTLQEKEGAF